jgi:hypothetical protein
MANPFFERPILNSPYVCPQRHWELDDQPRLPGISQPGRAAIVFATAAVTPDRGQKTSSFHGRGNIVS